MHGNMKMKIPIYGLLSVMVMMTFSCYTNEEIENAKSFRNEEALRLSIERNNAAISKARAMKFRKDGFQKNSNEEFENEQSQSKNANRLQIRVDSLNHSIKCMEYIFECPDEK
jgi:hypothetical protein